MARRPRSPGTRGPGLKTAVVPKFVDEANFRYFHSRWAEIDQIWRYHDSESSQLVFEMRLSARELLRREMRVVTSLGPAHYMIAV